MHHLESASGVLGGRTTVLDLDETGRERDGDQPEPIWNLLQFTVLGRNVEKFFFFCGVWYINYWHICSVSSAGQKMSIHNISYL